MSLTLNYKPQVLVDTENLSREEWLNYRRMGIGGSDAAAILGISPFCTKRDLYYDKIGVQVLVNEEEENWVAKEVGHRLEDLVAKIFSERTGLRVYPVRKMFRHPLYPFMLADVDFFIEYPDGSTGILECKTTNYNCRNKWANDSIPINYEYQVRHYMAVTNLKMDTVKNQPFALCQISGFGFLTVDEIAKVNRCRPNDPLRVEGCIHYCMDMELQQGHLFQEKKLFLDSVYGQLNHGYPQEVVAQSDIAKEVYRMINDHIFRYEDGRLYPEKFYRYECLSARRLAEMLHSEHEPDVRIDFLLAEAQRELAILLSEKKAEAVKKAFRYLITIVTGGPGTGKTTVEKVLLYIHKKLGGGEILLTSPTGRANRRMAESTGEAEAPTMHSALGLTSDEDTEAGEEMLHAEFIIADEFSMVDMRLFYEFVSRIRQGSRLIMIGDVNQIPSVGPGNVFRELIQSGVIPVTVLDIVFRQNENGRIVRNAHRMQENNAALEYGTDFVFVPAKDDAEASELIRKMYQGAVKQMGVEQVQVLTPYRKKGAVSVNALNEMLWNLANPKTEEIHEIRSGAKSFREGDKIIHNKNKNGISNGDTGYVTDIFLDEDNIETARLEFSDGRSVEYNADQLDLIEHAYATTVHKSQGSEYPVVILPWLPMFYKMLRRNILYTAVTRAKEMVIIVGKKQSIYRAVHNTESDRRNTMLGTRLIREYNRFLEEKKKEEGGGDYEQLAINL